MADPSTRYTRLELLGQGSLGCVYRARDVETGDEIALKTLESIGPEQLYRLKREFRTLATLRHRSLVRLHDLVVDPAGCFFTMELVEGPDFVGWVRDAAGDPPTSAAWGRLLDAAAELVEALSAVHRAGRLHRDVKPANVRVQRDGRVVLLDFDMALDLDAPRPRDDTAECAGTFAYMAPEQAFGQPVGPAADWYAFGTVLYEAITGRLPFQGSVGQVMLEKARRRPPRPSTIVPAVPPALDGLVEALLDPDPACRPDEASIRREITTLRGMPAAAPIAAAPPFVGRRRETELLERVLARRSDDLDVVHVHGPSGIGKTELVRHVLRDVQRDARCVVLRGRCYDRESVPYKAFDTIVDALSAHLRELPAGEVAALVPADGRALVRLFPVLARIRGVDAGAPLDADPADVRRRAFAGLRGLLYALARTQRLVLWIDDLQWADVDSSALLEALAHPPAPPPLALVLSYRSEDRERIPLLAMLRTTPDVAASIRETVVAVEPLDAAETLALARAMAPSDTDAVSHLARIADEAAGSPFFVGELVRHLAAHGRTEEAPPTLQEAMRTRVTGLGERARELLEVIAVAGGPIDSAVALDAAGALPRAAAQSLEEQALVRSTATAERVLLEMYHDRLKLAVTTIASGDTIARRHGQIAHALERTGTADARQLFAHYEGAGDRDGARRLALAAADATAAALAFHRAAELYGRAIELGVADELAVRGKRADALVDAGYGFEAARAFEELAGLREGAAPPDEVTRLRRRAAEQYLQHGHLTQGMAAIRRLLHAIGVQLPRTSAGTLLWFVRERRRLLRRGFAFTPRDPVTIPAETIDRIDTCFAAAAPLAMSDPIRAGAIAMHATREALDVGHRSMVIRLLAIMANREAVIGTRRSRRIGEQLLDRVERLAAEGTDPYEHATSDLAAGVTAFIEGRFAPARDRCRRAIATLEAGCRGVSFEIAVSRAYELTALAYLGELRELATVLPGAVADADARGALGLSIGLRVGQPALVWLVEDRPALGRRIADEWIARWPDERMLIPHYNHATAVVQSHLYERDGAAAWEQICAAWPGLRRAGFLLQVSSRVELLFLRARAAVARAALDPGARRALLRRASRDASALARTTAVAHAAPCAALVRATVAHAGERPEEAAALFEEAARGFERLAMRLHAVACRRALGVVRGDAALVVASDDALRAEGVRRPDAMASVVVAGG